MKTGAKEKKKHQPVSRNKLPTMVNRQKQKKKRKIHAV